MNRLNYIKYFLIAILVIQGCAKSIERDNPLDGKTLPFVTTVQVTSSNTKSTSATATGNITNDGGLAISSKGIICSKAPNAPIVPANTYEAGPGFTNFTIELNGLTPATTYYYKSYATNLLGTAYGNEMTFKTANDKPSISTNPPSGFTSSSITIGGTIVGTIAGTIISSNGLPVTQKGVVVSTIPFVDTNSAKIFAPGQNIVMYDLTANTLFSVNVPKLTEAKTYYIMAFAGNAQGVKFGNPVSVTTAANKPTIETIQVSNNTGYIAKSGGNIISNGGSPITAKGILWSKTKDAKIETTTTSTNQGPGPAIFPATFTSDLTSLEPGTTYYVKAYARNVIDVAYGAEIEFKATPLSPVIAPASFVNKYANSVEVLSSIIYDGGSPVRDFGFVYHTSPNPTLTNGGTKEPYGNNTNGISKNINFSSLLNNLKSGFTYYITSYVTTDVKTVYGTPEITFTPASTKPKVTTLTPNPSDIGFNSAKITGLVVDNGGATVTEKGVVVGESANPTINGYGTLKFPDLSNLTNISVNATNLKAGTTYFARAYAKNSVDFGYGDQISFPTKDSKPVLDKITQTTPTSSSIVVNGAIKDNFGLDITEKGFIWSKFNTLDINSVNNTGKENVGKGLSSFSFQISNLQPGTLYYVRSFATNASGTGLSDPSSFTTLPTKPSITSYNPIVNGSNATLRAEITSDGGAKITSAGFIVSTTRNAIPNSTNQFPVENPSVGDISYTRTGLVRGTYWYRVYAINAANERVDSPEYSFVIQ